MTNLSDASRDISASAANLLAMRLRENAAANAANAASQQPSSSQPPDSDGAFATSTQSQQVSPSMPVSAWAALNACTASAHVHFMPLSLRCKGRCTASCFAAMVCLASGLISKHA